MFSSWLDISSRSYQMVSRALSSCRCSMFFKVAHLSCLDPGPETSDLETIVHVSRLLNFWILISKSTTWPEVMRRCIWSQFNKQHFGVIYCFIYIYIFMCCIYTSTIFPVFVINDQDYSFYTQSFPMTLKTSSSTRFALVSSIQKPEPLRFFPTALHDPLKKEKHTTWNIHDHVNPQLAPFRRHVYVSTITKKNTCINVDIELFNVYIRLSPVTQCQWRQKNQKGRMMNNEQLHIWLQRVSRCRTRVCSTIITNHFVYK